MNGPLRSAAVGYRLGIDVGTTFTAAAIAEGDRCEALALGTRALVAPTVVFVEESGDTTIGEAAERRAATNPARVVREFKRRIGDPTPIIVAGTPWPTDLLLARVLNWVLSRAVTERGTMPDSVTLTHPATWGDFRLEILRQAAVHAGLPAVDLLSEPAAAAAYYATERDLPTGAVVAVYDFGGGTFDAAVVRRSASGFELIGVPQGLEHAGGLDIDAALFDIVRGSVGGAIDALDPDDPSVVVDLQELRRDCTAAKEALSDETSTVVPIRLPGLRHDLRITRTELEDRIRPLVIETTHALRRAVESAGVAVHDLSAVLLVGGSSRVPLVGELVAGELGRPIAVNVNPKLAVAQGAALHGAPAPVAAPLPLMPPPPAPPPPPPSELVTPAPFTPTAPPPRSRRGVLIAAAVIAAVVLIGAVLIVATRGGGSNAASTTTTTTTSTTDTTTTTTTSTTVPPATTNVVHYLPFRADSSLIPQTTFTSTGNCFTTSSVSGRTDAFRCSSDNDAPGGGNLFDPCFLDANNFQTSRVACPDDATGNTVVLITLSQPPDNTGASGEPSVWALTLANGATCNVLTSMPPQIGDIQARFGCSDRSVTTEPTGSGAMTVQRLDPATNQITTVGVTTALT
jgi:actin-like ATPase involved in cell morphogenesis